MRGEIVLPTVLEIKKKQKVASILQNRRDTVRRRVANGELLERDKELASRNKVTDSLIREVVEDKRDEKEGTHRKKRLVYGKNAREEDREKNAIEYRKQYYLTHKAKIKQRTKDKYWEVRNKKKNHE